VLLKQPNLPRIYRAIKEATLSSHCGRIGITLIEQGIESVSLNPFNDDRVSAQLKLITWRRRNFVAGRQVAVVHAFRV
jgi:hypothetical protein